MTKLSPLSASSPTHFKHDLFFNSCADLKTVAKIAIPLIMIVGAIYYLWRYSSQTPTPEVEPKPSLEQEIDDLIKRDQFCGVETKISSLSNPEKVAKWNELFYERRCLYYFKIQSFTYAYADALKIQELAKKNDLLIQIFSACLKQKLAWQISDEIKTSDPDSLKEGCIAAAYAAENLTLAFSLVPRLSDVKKREKWLGILVPKIAEKYLSIKELLPYAVIPGPKQDELLEKSIPILIEENHLTDARALTWGITDEEKRVFWQTKIKTSFKTQELVKLPDQ